MNDREEMSVHPYFPELANRHLIGNCVCELIVFVETLQEGDYLNDQCQTREEQLLLEDFRHNANHAEQEIAGTLIVIPLGRFDSDND